jgi:hypothetical protein
MNKKLILFCMIVIAIVLRSFNFALCDVNDRGQSALGVVENLPPLQAWLSAPFFLLTNNYDFAPLIANIILDIIAMLLLYDLGRILFKEDFGVILAFIYAIVPATILSANWISPETTELVSLVAIIYCFINVEIRREEDFFTRTCLYLSVAIGCFAKQQTILIMIPLFIYGLIKHRLAIFKKFNYYIILVGCLPYVLFVLSHPEMIGAVFIYFGQPVVGGALLHRVYVFLMNASMYILPLVILFIFYLFARNKDKWESSEPLLSANRKDATMFMIIVLIFYTIFVFFTMPYFHLLVVPLIFLCGQYVLNSKYQKLILALLFTGTVLIIVCSIPYVSIKSYTGCEIKNDNDYPFFMTFFNKLDGKTNTHAYTMWIDNKEYFEKLLENETMVIVAGNIGQDVKYNVHKIVRLPSIINTDDISKIHYAFLFYPIDMTYQGVRAWDSEYSEYIVNNSELVFSGNMSTVRYVEVRRFNLTKLDYNLSMGSLINKSRVSLGFER